MTELNTPVEQGESGKIGAQIKTAPAVRQHCGSGASPISNFSGSDRLMAEATKTCTRCGARRPLTDFAKSPVGAGGLRADCRSCRAVLDRDYLLRRRFGISAAEYDDLLNEQGGGCALCGTTKAHGRWGRFHVDHCHETGRIRGLLCHSCNVALGVLGDTPAKLQTAYRYVTGKESTDG